jgi:hypothetical protein
MNKADDGNMCEGSDTVVLGDVAKKANQIACSKATLRGLLFMYKLID